MSSTVTLAQLTARARDLADQPASGGFIDDARLYEQINYALATLWAAMTDANEEYGLSRQSISVLAGTEEYSLPTDYYKTRKCFPKDSSGNRMAPLRRFELNELGATILPPARDQLKYRVLGKKLMLAPKPEEAFTLEHWYVPESPQFNVASPSTAIDSVFPIGWDEYLVARGAKYILAKEDSSALAAVSAMEQDALSRVMLEVKPRDSGSPKTVSDAYRRWSPYEE